MSDLVLDVSLSCAWCFADEATAESWAILERLQTHRAHVPALWLWETAHVLVQAERRERISPAAIRAHLRLLEGLPISVDQPSTASAWHNTLALAPQPPPHQPRRRLSGAGAAPSGGHSRSCRPRSVGSNPAEIGSARAGHHLHRNALIKGRKPEGMARMTAGFGQAGGHHCSGLAVGVGRLGHDPHHCVWVIGQVAQPFSCSRASHSVAARCSTWP